jgi:hypothetical protein
MPCHPSVTVCTHIKVTGVRCGSPALRGEQFCYFHQRMLRGVPTPPESRLHPVALLESDEAIQASLMEVVNALVRNTIDFRRADLILKALYIAVKNSRRSRFDMWDDRIVRQIPDYPAPPRPVHASQVATPATAPVIATPAAPLLDATPATPDKVYARAVPADPVARRAGKQIPPPLAVARGSE